MSEIDIDSIKVHLKKDLKNYQQMIKIFDKLLKHEKALNKAYNDFEKGLGKVAENELNESLKQMVLKVKQTFKDSSQHKQKFVSLNKIYVKINLIDKKILLSLNSSIEQVKDRKTILNDYKKKKDLTFKKDQTVKMNNDANKHNLLAQQFEDARKEQHISGLNLNNKVRLYISEKDSELKALFLHFTNYSMFSHAYALECQSKLSSQIHDIKEEEETQLILDKYFGVAHHEKKIELKQEEKK